VLLGGLAQIVNNFSPFTLLLFLLSRIKQKKPYGFDVDPVSFGADRFQCLLHPGEAAKMSSLCRPLSHAGDQNQSP
jgi:hypothetical protein